MSTEHSFDPDGRRREVLEEQGFSVDDARIRMGEKVVGRTTELPKPLGAERHRRPSGNVRGFHDGEPRDSELYPSTGPLSDEQSALNKKWIDEIRRQGGDAAIQRIIDGVERDIPIDPDNRKKSLEARERMTTARLRTHFEKRSQ
jgi:hypothetical protein